MTLAAFLHVAYESMAPMWVELSFLVFFALGFAFLRIDGFARNSTKRSKQLVENPKPRAFDARLRKVIEDETALGKHDAVLKAWRVGCISAPTPPELIKPVVHALLDLEPEDAASELLEHIRKHAMVLSNSRVACAVLDAVARAGEVRTMEELWEAFQKDLRIKPTYQMYEMLVGGFASVGDEKKVAKVFETMNETRNDEMLVGGFASVGDEKKVAKVFETMNETRIKLTARGYSLTIKGFLKNNMVDAVLKQLLAMNKRGIHIPPFATVQFLRISSEANRAAEAFHALTDASIALPPEALSLLLEDCAKRGNLELATSIEALAREAKQPLLCGAYDALLIDAVLKQLLAMNKQGIHIPPFAIVQYLRISTEANHTAEAFRALTDASVTLPPEALSLLLEDCVKRTNLELATSIEALAREIKQPLLSGAYDALLKLHTSAGHLHALDLFEEMQNSGVRISEGLCVGLL
eukprot:CAMPEP_0172930502 /NCGR_PEP_ID=MMETSP1075-20121228/219021_1 /TAXON_ID=2916 /ORGANISM="Ceratium fusus, Strain PA161109" /LENGTH=467 /DNA_ID=CAMNT_0013791811 /DNA_START=79 /DNA_END=1480 /DNA_ORIENTATION=+